MRCMLLIKARIYIHAIAPTSEVKRAPLLRSKSSHRESLPDLVALMLSRLVLYFESGINGILLLIYVHLRFHFLVVIL